MRHTAALLRARRSMDARASLDARSDRDLRQICDEGLRGGSPTRRPLSQSSRTTASGLRRRRAMETIRLSPETQGQPPSGEAQEQHRQHRASHGFSRDELRAEAREVWTKTTQAARRPRIGAAMAGAAVLAATAIMGVSEAAVAAVAGYGVYRMLKRKRPEPGPDAADPQDDDAREDD